MEKSENKNKNTAIKTTISGKNAHWEEGKKRVVMV